MGLIVPSAMPPEHADQPLPYEWFVGIDWGSQHHQVCVLDRDRRLVGERAVDHDGASLAQLAAWLWTVSAGQPQRVAVAIEVPRGAIVEGLVERGFHVFAINWGHGGRSTRVPLEDFDRDWTACGIAD